jgi:acyl-CoA reductase-like NAD-dependent aldehyde dehydrogenase
MNTDTDALLRRLGLGSLNPGAWSGAHGWSNSTGAALLNVRNPANGTLLSQVRPATLEDYEHVLTSAVAAAAAWRECRRRSGEAVRLFAEELRRHRDDPNSGLARTARSSPRVRAKFRDDDIADFAWPVTHAVRLTMH